jgi:hypothetical protein
MLLAHKCAGQNCGGFFYLLKILMKFSWHFNGRTTRWYNFQSPFLHWRIPLNCAFSFRNVLRITISTYASLYNNILSLHHQRSRGTVPLRSTTQCTYWQWEELCAANWITTLQSSIWQILQVLQLCCICIHANCQKGLFSFAPRLEKFLYKNQRW